MVPMSENPRPRSGEHGPVPAVSPRLLGALTVLMLASWLLSMAPLPYSLFSGLTALGALGVLVPVVLQAFRRGRRGMAVFAAVIGVPATLMIVTGAVVSLLFYGPMAELQECRAAAITERAQAQCDAQVQESVAGWLAG